MGSIWFLGILLALKFIVYKHPTDDSINYHVKNSTEKEAANINNYEIEVKTDSINIIIPIKDIPLLYDQLTKDIDINTKDGIELLEFQLAKIMPKLIFTKNDIFYILINYNCGVKLCNYMLIEYRDRDKELQSVYLNFGIYMDDKVSENENAIAFNFIQTEGLNVYNDITLVDIDNMEIKKLDIPSAYTYIVSSYKWKNNKLYITYKNDNKSITSIN